MTTAPGGRRVLKIRQIKRRTQGGRRGRRERHAVQVPAHPDRRRRLRSGRRVCFYRHLRRRMDAQLRQWSGLDCGGAGYLRELEPVPRDSGRAGVRHAEHSAPVHCGPDGYGDPHSDSDFLHAALYRDGGGAGHRLDPHVEGAFSAQGLRRELFPRGKIIA